MLLLEELSYLISDFHGEIVVEYLA